MSSLALISLLQIICKDPEFPVSNQFCTEETIMLRPKNAADAVAKERLVIVCRTGAEQQYGWDRGRYEKCLKKGKR